MLGLVLLFIDYLEYYHIDHSHHDQHSLFVMSGSGTRARQRLNTKDYEWQSRYHYKRRTNIVLSDMEPVQPCNRPLIRLLRIYCCEWGCQSVIFEKFQVDVFLPFDHTNVARPILF